MQLHNHEKGGTRSWLLLTVLASAMLGGGWWLWTTAPVDRADERIVPFSIERGESIDSIASRLKKQGLIRSSAAFKMMTVIRGITRNIQAGDYSLSRTYPLIQVAVTLTRGTLDVRVTLLEGWRREEMAAALEERLREEGVTFDPQVFVKETEGKEGYLFPDTYDIPRQMSEADIAELIFANFQKKVDATLRENLERQNGFLHESLTLASIVEREARTPTDRSLVAGILIKRWRAGWPLQADATVQYALGYQEKERTWWKKVLTKVDLQIDSPYNTYRYPGLPPSPIANPSRESIEAVANPTASEYWYYLSDLQGTVHYATSLHEHQQNITRYLQK